MSAATSGGCPFPWSPQIARLPPMPGVFPDYPAPVVRNSREGREIVLVRLGHAAASEDGRPAVINIRNTSSPHWCGWPKPETRGLVPFNSLAEYAPEPNPETKKKDVVWFALSGNSSNIRLRRRLDRVQGGSWHQIQTASGDASGLRLPDDEGERGRCTDPSQGDAGDPDHRQGMQPMVVLTVG